MKNFCLSKFREAPLPDEREVVAKWTGSKPVVSVVCTTYNHEAYVEDAIRGFLIQKTDFPFEIVIHDDVSTDSTQSIINRYAAAYPNIIKTVFQQQNQYSQGAMILMLASSYAAGDYIAFCEGDDYWIATDKLQSQVDALKEIPNCEMCFHPAVMTKNEVPYQALFCRRSEGNRLFDVGPIIRCGGSFMPTASMLIRRSFFDRAFRDGGSFYQRYMMGYFFQIHCSLQGGACYIDRPMSVYRSFSEGSWTQTISRDQGFYKKWASNYLEALRETDRMTGYAYSSDIALSIRRCHLSVLNNIGLDLAYRREYFVKNRKYLGVLGTILWFCVFRTPVIHTLFKRIRSFLQTCRKQKMQSRSGNVSA
ncbi:glycosyltransferase [Methylomicrobium sp. Wu6]|uniref:glycosyltransferase family 2 protein n=1 Tax=Methylomicrobium sp. Wu6 TaxID=3107928 RepID=UPI002DD64399|nr:glycosyltransferase [Methylomicrobium sp. Wu6]MEC4747375.1 glycosyltransferase [Methylomicrobium sp. Wu6]